ncbi:hypothetical protein [Govanella unica]|uniref:Uncharacterized protein n=1 Tax=Govanella unica TaxID=2975056 RepID=A0A9X3Z873_9PROT|nr:hypothetical protein [Govania unica]MDA5194942.1 hypothetical protein [Govania unica]
MTDFSARYRSATSLTLSGLNSLADGSRADSSNYDNSTNRDIEASIKLKVAGATAAAIGYLRLEIKRSHENSDFEDSGNTELLSVVQMNGTTAVTAIVEGVRLSPHQKISILNASGAALAASGNSAELIGLKYTDA